AALTAAVLFGATVSARADEKELRDKMAGIEKELMSIRKKASEDADVKAAGDALKAAQQKYNETLDAAMIKADPKAKELLDEKKKVQDEMAALKKAEAEAKKKAAAEKKEKKD